MLVHPTTLYSKLARIIFGVLCLVCMGQVANESSTPQVTVVEQSVKAGNTQFESSQTGAANLPNQKRPSSNVPRSIEVASGPSVNQVSWEPQVLHQLAAEIFHAFELDNLTYQRAGNLRAPSSYSSVIVSYSSGRSPPRPV